jgi:hypothetical protein
LDDQDYRFRADVPERDPVGLPGLSAGIRKSADIITKVQLITGRSLCFFVNQSENPDLLTGDESPQTVADCWRALLVRYKRAESRSIWLVIEFLDTDSEWVQFLSEAGASALAGQELQDFVVAALASVGSDELAAVPPGRRVERMVRAAKTNPAWPQHLTAPQARAPLTKGCVDGVTDEGRLEAGDAGHLPGDESLEVIDIPPVQAPAMRHQGSLPPSDDVVQEIEEINALTQIGEKLVANATALTEREFQVTIHGVAYPVTSMTISSVENDEELIAIRSQYYDVMQEATNCVVGHVGRTDMRRRILATVPGLSLLSPTAWKDYLRTILTSSALGNLADCAPDLRQEIFTQAAIVMGRQPWFVRSPPMRCDTSTLKPDASEVRSARGKEIYPSRTHKTELKAKAIALVVEAIEKSIGKQMPGAAIFYPRTLDEVRAVPETYRREDYQLVQSRYLSLCRELWDLASRLGWKEKLSTALGCNSRMWGICLCAAIYHWPPSDLTGQSLEQIYQSLKESAERYARTM